MFTNQFQDTRRFMRRKAPRSGDSGRLKPDLGDLLVASYVNMRGFRTLVREEEDAIGPHTQDCPHD